MDLTISVGIMAYNEERIIGSLLEEVLRQKLEVGRVEEIIVVSSGCTDNTEGVVRGFMPRDARIRLLVQPRREGKASAINLFLGTARGDVLILESGDTIPLPGTYDRLLAPFTDPRVGMTGARPVPQNSPENFMGFTAHLLWNLHHEIALRHPKLGELVAFRNFVKRIPSSTAVDEASIEAIVRDHGFELRYVPDAVVLNKGPDNIADFIRQRRRIAAGHLHLLKVEGHRVSTLSPLRILKILARKWPPGIRESLWIIGAIALEAVGRLLGAYDYYITGRNPYIWEIARSTKSWDQDR